MFPFSHSSRRDGIDRSPSESVAHPFAAPAEAVPPVADPAVGGRVRRTSANLSEAIMDSVSSVRDSLHERYRSHFNILRREIIDFTKAHDIPIESLAKPDLLREAAGKLSTQDLERLANLLERFEYLIVKKEPGKEKLPEHLQEIERLYHLEDQYTSQVTFLEYVGILKEGAIIGIDGHEYPIPKLEQIALRLFERRGELSAKHDQGFTKLLLVPFGMNLDMLISTLKQFLLDYKGSHPDFMFDTDDPISNIRKRLKRSDTTDTEAFQNANGGDHQELVYYPLFFNENHQGKTKTKILEDQSVNPASFPGWTVHLFQPSDPSNQHSLGFAPIPEEKGTTQGNEIPRQDLKTGKYSCEYLDILGSAKQQDSPYCHESGLTPEDWISAFMMHLHETGKPLDENKSCYLVGAFFPSLGIPRASWSIDYMDGRSYGSNRVSLNIQYIHGTSSDIGSRFSVII
ncbi:TPA: hypothetical protein DEP34_01090 [Candidatus Uhrbacteria bacterium]|uniref:Uncharacterized protein n=2 Tax=Candidatus Uhriibacteriota TaxID=1752732 RepID=A0A0G1Q7G5_9BACT|nr:MAG: hypothetical protein UX45_C0020G0004 [Candidatus Uhrbacteria bacterium GW2011_GWF2_46_218]KKU41006.1 MAG: hypothetical protein UX57_C0007G0038 [Candidatus Uhrbacteria bacterium GW2011_GWE2_46_68]HBK33633.1 hypothetical protein [Candidatus Uhrbacteria bacterium]HCB18966.1 hypothetical protein [Candidatus Uhrbacteria bacterium]